MAGEIVTTTSTGAGLMERRQARILAQLALSSRLFNGVWTQESTNASTTQFPKYPAPGASVTAATEANASSASALTINAATATLAAFPYITSASKLFLSGGEDARATVDAIIANEVVSSVDKQIASVITEANYTTTPVADVVTLSAFLTAKATLENVGYNGTQCFICSPNMAYKIMADAGKSFYMNANEQMITSGNIGSLYGVQFLVVPSGWLPTATTSGKVSGLIYYKEFALGFAYRNMAAGGLVDFTEAEKHTYLEIAGTAYCDAASLAATAGIICLSDSATL